MKKILPKIMAGLCGVALLFAPTLAIARIDNPQLAHVDAFTLFATNVTSSSATLVGSYSVTQLGISYSGLPVSVILYFEYGLTANYGSSTPAITYADQGVYSIPITSLSPGTTYHFRAAVDHYVYVTTRDFGTAFGGDLTFTTPVAPVSLVVSNINDSGAGSLRSAIASVQAGGLITFAANLSGQTITLTGGQLVLTTNVTIDASELANGIAINGNAGSRIFQVNSGANVGLRNLSLTNGYQGPSGSGGAILNNGTLTLNNCTLAGNSVAPTGAGGAIHNVGQLTLSGCTLFGNTGAFAGAINNNAVCTLKNCTFSGNSATAGNGGAIDNAFSATLNILHCTFSGNSTAGEGYGGAIDNYLSQVNLTNTIVAGNPVYEDIYNWSGSTINAGGSNIVQVLGNGGTVLGGNTIRAVNPLLGSLANNGGPTLTRLPQSGSPAINAGVNSFAASLSADQRGRLRLSGGIVDIGAVEVQSPTVTTFSANGVTTNAATLNGTVNPLGITTTAYFQYGLTTNYGTFTSPINPGTGNSAVPYSVLISGLAAGTTYHFRAVASTGDGLTYGTNFSLTTPSSFSLTNVVSNTNDTGAGSLRTAIISTAPGGFITFAPHLSGQTIKLTSGQLVLNSDVTIDASILTNGISINGNASNRIFLVNDDANVVLNALTLTNGYQGTNGFAGAIVNYGTLALSNCTLAGNSAAPSGTGGAIHNAGLLTLSGCALFANTAAFAGAINNNAVCTLKNCNFFGNTATAGNGGAIDNAFDATLNILHCTFSGNNTVGAGGGIDNYLSQVNITNTIIGGNTGYGNGIYNWSGSAVTFGGSNIVQGLTSDGTVVGSSSIRAVNPLLGPLANNGGRTLSQLLLNGSPAIDAGQNSAASGLATDQRGQPRLSGGAVDIGAAEMQAAESPYYPATIIVTTTADSGPFSLRAAVASIPFGGIITFAPNLSGQTITLTSGQIVVGNSMTIDASALANGISINGNATSRIFEVNNGANVVLNSLTITNGFNDGSGFQSYGGGILGLVGNLTINNCKLVNNRCVNGTAGALAAIYGSLTMNATTVSGNLCDNNSAIYIQDQPATIVGCTISGNGGWVGDALRFAAAFNDAALSVVNCTFSGNFVTGDSGFGAAAITLQANPGFTATAGLTNCTVVSNSVVEAGMAGAIYLDPRTGTNKITLYNSIISGNTSGGVAADISTNVTPNSAFNLIGVGGGLVNGVNGNKVGINNPLLGALGNYGGATQTMPPLPGSPAIDSGGTVIFATDQRGSPRLYGSGVDIGAVELGVPFVASVFTGAAPGQGLDLQGSFLYAVNIGDNGAPGLIGDANFTADNVSGVAITTPGGTLNTVSNWAGPNFGGTTDGLRLTQVMSSIRWTPAPAIFTVNLSGLQVGASYRLQLLFIESLSDRVFNVTVNGTTVVPNFRLLDYGPQGTAIVIPYDFTAASTNALIQLGGGVGGNDNNPLLSGFTLETLASVTTPFKIIQLTKLGNGTFQFSFTNLTGASFQVFAATNAAQPTADWSMIGFAIESPVGSGQFQVTDAQATNYLQRFYRVKSP